MRFHLRAVRIEHVIVEAPGLPDAIAVAANQHPFEGRVIDHQFERSGFLPVTELTAERQWRAIDGAIWETTPARGLIATAVPAPPGALETVRHSQIFLASMAPKFLAALERLLSVDELNTTELEMADPAKDETRAALDEAHALVKPFQLSTVEREAIAAAANTPAAPAAEDLA